MFPTTGPPTSDTGVVVSSTSDSVVVDVVDVVVLVVLVDVVVLVVLVDVVAGLVPMVVLVLVDVVVVEVDVAVSGHSGNSQLGPTRLKVVPSGHACTSVVQNVEVVIHDPTLSPCSTRHSSPSSQSSSSSHVSDKSAVNTSMLSAEMIYEPLSSGSGLMYTYSNGLVP